MFWGAEKWHRLQRHYCRELSFAAEESEEHGPWLFEAATEKKICLYTIVVKSFSSERKMQNRLLLSFWKRPSSPWGLKLGIYRCLQWQALPGHSCLHVFWSLQPNVGREMAIFEVISTYSYGSRRKAHPGPQVLIYFSFYRKGFLWYPFLTGPLINSPLLTERSWDISMWRSTARSQRSTWLEPESFR